MRTFREFLEQQKWTVGPSDISGVGIIITKPIKKGELIGVSHEKYPEIQCTHLGRHYNHSDKPNAESKFEGSVRKLYALKDLEPGDEVTADYRKQPELEQPQKGWS